MSETQSRDTARDFVLPLGAGIVQLVAAGVMLLVLGRNTRHELGRAGKLTLARGLIALIAQELAARGLARKRGTALALAATPLSLSTNTNPFARICSRTL